MFRLQHLKYVIPNLCTSFSLLLGLASVLQSIDGNHDLAAWMILWGVLLDKLDGTTARLLHASSEVGAPNSILLQIFVSFGICSRLSLVHVSSKSSLCSPWIFNDSLWCFRCCCCIQTCSF